MLLSETHCSEETCLRSFHFSKGLGGKGCVLSVSAPSPNPPVPALSGTRKDPINVHGIKCHLLKCLKMEPILDGILHFCSALYFTKPFTFSIPVAPLDEGAEVGWVYCFPHSILQTKPTEGPVPFPHTRCSVSFLQPKPSSTSPHTSPQNPLLRALSSLRVVNHSLKGAEAPRGGRGSRGFLFQQAATRVSQPRAPK